MKEIIMKNTFRHTQGVSVFPVGLISKFGLSSPVVKMGTGVERKHVVDGWYDTALVRLSLFI